MPAGVSGGQFLFGEIKYEVIVYKFLSNYCILATKVLLYAQPECLHPASDNYIGSQMVFFGRLRSFAAEKAIPGKIRERGK